MEMRIVFSFLKKWIWLCLVLVFFAALAAYVISVNSPKIYRATSTLLVTQANRANTNAELAANERMARTFQQRLTGSPVIQETINQVGLTESQADSLDLDISIIRDTQLIHVVAEHPEPKVAQAIANTIPLVFNSRNKEQLIARYEDLKNDLEEKTAVLTGDILELEKVLELEDSTIATSQLEKKLQQLYNEQDRLYDDLSDIRLAETLNLDAIIVDTPDSLPAQMVRPEQYDEMKASLEKETAILDSEILELEQELESLDNSIVISQLQKKLQQLYKEEDRLLSDYSEIRFAETLNVNAIIVDIPASLPTEPVRPKVKQNIIMAALIGAITGLAIAFLVEMLDDTVKPGSDFERQFGTDPLVQIGHIDNASDGILVTQTMPRSSIAESFRMLRTNISFASVDRPVKTLVVTSPNPGDGKSSTAANLAVVMANRDNSVLLIDADLRKPSLNSIFDVSNGRGLTTSIINEDEPINQNLVDVNIPGLTLLPSGPLPPNPSDLLESQRMGKVLASFEEQFDIVIIDAPPVLVVADSSILAKRASGVVLVVRSNKTDIDEVKRAQSQIKGADALLLGIVLNDVREQREKYISTEAN